QALQAVQASEERSVGGDFRVADFRSKAEDRGERHLCAMRPADHRAFLSFAGKAGLLSHLFSRRATYDRDRLIAGLKTLLPKRCGLRFRGDAQRYSQPLLVLKKHRA